MPAWLCITYQVSSRWAPCSSDSIFSFSSIMLRWHLVLLRVKNKMHQKSRNWFIRCQLYLIIWLLSVKTWCNRAWSSNTMYPHVNHSGLFSWSFSALKCYFLGSFSYNVLLVTTFHSPSSKFPTFHSSSLLILYWKQIIKIYINIYILILRQCFLYSKKRSTKI